VRVRFRFTKLGKVRFTSQRDVARMWERALRRANLPLAYTAGFSPRPQLSFGLALPTGCESLAEYVDVAIDEGRQGADPVEVPALPGVLSPLLPAGIEVEEAELVRPGGDSLQQAVTSCSWMMRFAGIPRVELEDRVAALLASPEVPIVRERKGREEHDDLRPSVRTLAVADANEDLAEDPSGRTVGLRSELATQPRGVRPVELTRGLIAVADGSPVQLPPGQGARHAPARIPVLDRACRTHQWIEREGLRVEPLGRRAVPATAPRAQHALERAS